MKLSAKSIKILKIASLCALAVLEIYLIYATAASMYTYHQHPRFEAADGSVAQSSGYRTQFFLCLAFDIVIPILAGLLVWLYWFKKPKRANETVAQNIDNTDMMEAVAATDAAETHESDQTKTDGGQ
ncbi:MAG: hypothetical protein J1G04_03665 [Clostridiales bacterium]|nr:hypothetical protein [Clostridiales bacterium]